MFIETVSAGTCDEFTFQTRKKVLGVRFGRLVPFNRYLDPSVRMDYFVWHCQCDCGRMPLVAQNNLLRGTTTSCGCYHREIMAKHGRSGIVDGKRTDRTYSIWCSMIGRCCVPSAGGYKRYGAKGITVCDRWRNSFEAFLADMGEAHAGKSIDRWPNKTGNYEPGNCRWATPKQQVNNRSNNLVVEYEGQAMTLKEASELCGLEYGCLTVRYKKGLRGEALFFKGSYLGRNQFSLK